MSKTSRLSSHGGGVCLYAGCHIIWASKLQSLVALSTIKAEHIALSSSLCDVIPVIQLMIEIPKNGFPVLCTAPYVYYKAFDATWVH